jgi:hypothetical protein
MTKPTMAEQPIARASADRVAAFLEAFDDETAWINVFNEGDAVDFVQHVVDVFTARLRRDPRWTRLRYADFDLLFADMRQRLADDLMRRISSPVDEFRDAPEKAAIETFCGGDQEQTK